MLSLGKRIKEYRESLAMSQEKLAKLMGVARPTISQMENDERRIYADELKKLAQIFNTSIDGLLNPRKEPRVFIKEDRASYHKDAEIRINVPQKKLDKFKEVLLYILNKVGAKPNIGETVIYKLLYFMDFNYYEKFEEQLIGATYKKNRYGPTPIEFRKIVEYMARNEEIIRVADKYFDYPQTKYLPRRAADLSKLNAREKEVIDGVLERLSDMTAKQISEYSHNDVPWLTTEEGRIIEYESVFYRTPAYSVREYDQDIQRN